MSEGKETILTFRCLNKVNLLEINEDNLRNKTNKLVLCFTSEPFV